MIKARYRTCIDMTVTRVSVIIKSASQVVVLIFIPGMDPLWALSSLDRSLSASFD